jgi:ATP-binding cassette subfamily B protein
LDACFDLFGGNPSSITGGRYRQLWDKQNGFIVSANGAMYRIKPEHLAQMPIFHSIDKDMLNKMTDMFVVEHHDPDQQIIREGDIGSKFYVIARGREKVTRNNGDQEQELSVLEDGDHVGEIAPFKNIARTASVKTITPTVLLSLSQKNFWHLVDQYPHIRSYLKETVEKRIH